MSPPQARKFFLDYLREPPGQSSKYFILPPRASRAKPKIFYTTSAALPARRSPTTYVLEAPSARGPAPRPGPGADRAAFHREIQISKNPKAQPNWGKILV